MKIDSMESLYDCSSSESSDGSSTDASCPQMNCGISQAFHSATGIADVSNSNSLPYALAGASNLVSLDGLHTGVPTRTTPTLTPTTLKSIEQTFLEQAFLESTQSHEREAGFVPPLVEPSQPTPAQTENSNFAQQQHQQITQQLQQIQQQRSDEDSQHNFPENQQLQLQSEQQQQKKIQNRKNMGGRRPNRAVGISPEEEERRQLRRERNKAAAARCRKRRMDHTNELLKETDSLEQVKQRLQEDIHKLQQTKEELEFILESHKAVCRLQSSSPPDVKPVVKPEGQLVDMDCKPQTLHRPVPLENQGSRPNRPNSLPVASFDNNNRPNSLPIFTEPKIRTRPNSLQFKPLEATGYMKSSNEIAGIPITTPSNGIPFNFDSLMEGGTGLTPVSTPLIPSCSSQQRNISIPVDLTSPDANHPPKLVSL